MGTTIFEIPIKDTFVDSSNPNTNYGSYYAMLLGLYNSTTIYRTLLQFSTSAIPSGYLITKAEIILYLIRNDYPLTTKTYNIYRVRQNFLENTVTYNNQPTITSTPDASFTITNELSTYTRIDVTDLLKEWYEGKFTNYGLMIKSSNEAVNSLIGFYSSNFSNEAYFPMLEVTFELPIQVSTRQFGSSTESDLTTTNSYQFSASLNVSWMSNYTYFVKNKGSNPCTAQLQISHNDEDWIYDSLEVVINPGETKPFVPKILAKYARIAYKSTVTDNSTTIDITLQTQA